jgi:hypothetical protein
MESIHEVHRRNAEFKKLREKASSLIIKESNLNQSRINVMVEDTMQSLGNVQNINRTIKNSE